MARSFRILTWLAVGIWVQFASPLQAALNTERCLTEDTLYGDLVRELGASLTRNERFTLLPNNLASVSVSPEHDPVFTMWPPAATSRLTNLVTAVETYTADRGGFRLLRDGKVLAASKDEVVLGGAFSNNWLQFAIVGKSGNPRWLQYWVNKEPREAFRVGDDWGFRITGGLKLNSSTNATPDLGDPSGGAKVIESGSETVFLLRTNQYSAMNAPGWLTVVVADKSGLRSQTFTNAPAGNEQGAVRIGNDRWLLIGPRLMRVDLETPPASPDRDLESLLKAYEAGDRETFFRLLERVTQYWPNQVSGVAKILNDRRDPLERLDSMASSTLSGLKEWKLTEVPAENRARLEAALTAYRGHIEQFIAELDNVRSAKLGIVPSKVGAALQQGFQFFDGWWITQPRLLTQEGVNSAVFTVFYLDKSFAKKYGVFRLNNSGHLTLLGAYEIPVDPSEQGSAIKLSELWPPGIQHLKAGNGDDLIFVPCEGLARVGGGKWEWLDRSPEFKMIHQLIGADRRGQLYFMSARTAEAARTQVDPRQSPNQDAGNYWVYRPNAPLRQVASALLFPVNCMPIVDTSNRVWFTSRVRSALEEDPRIGSLAGRRAFFQACEAMVKAPLRQLTINDLTRGAPPEDRYSMFVDLYCHDGKDLSRVATNVAALGALLAGRDGAIIGAGRNAVYDDGLIPAGVGGERGAFIVDHDTLTKGLGLHSLAEKENELLMKIAPMSSQPAELAFPKYTTIPASLPSLCRNGDLLWVSQHNSIEAYREGKPLGIAKRLTVLNNPRGRTILVGPVNTTNNPAMLIVPEKQGLPLMFWALPGTDGMDLIRDEVEQPRVPPIPGSTFSYAISGPQYSRVSYNRWPAVLTDSHQTWVHDSRDALWKSSGPGTLERVTEAGAPVFIGRGGELIVERPATSLRGFRICSGETRQDITPTFMRPLRVLAETSDGLLVCGSPDALVWLSRNASGDYSIAREIPLQLGGFIQAYVTETETKVFLAVTDAQEQPYLAMVDKP